jgi:hypothetical protein
MYSVTVGGAAQALTPSITAAGSGYGASVSGTMTWNGSGCSTNPVLNVTTNSGGAISSVSTATQGVCSTAPSSSATTWTAGGGLSSGSSAAFQVAQYTINANGLGITFTTPPGAGTNNVVASYSTYGGVAFEANCNGTIATACGGHFISDSNFLGWADDIVLYKGNGEAFSNITVDAGAWSNITFDNEVNAADQFSNFGMYWSAAQIRAKHNSSGAYIMTGFSAPQPSSAPNSGVAGTLSNIDVGSSVNWAKIGTSQGIVSASLEGVLEDYKGSLICWGCSPGATPSNMYEWIMPGQTYSVTWNGVNTFTFNAPAVYLSDQTTGSSMYLQAKSAINLQPNNVTEFGCNGTACTLAEPIMLASYTVSGLPSCTSGLAGSVAYVTDASSPTYNATLTGGSSTKTLAMCNGSNWTAH